MNQIECDDVFDQEIKTRWTEWEPTVPEKSDWTRRMMDLQREDAITIIRRMADKSWGKKPSAKDWFGIRDVLCPKQSERKYQEVCITRVYVGGCVGAYSTLQKGTRSCSWYKIPTSEDIQCTDLQMKILDMELAQIRDHFGFDARFELFFMDEPAAFKRSKELQGK